MIVLIEAKTKKNWNRRHDSVQSSFDFTARVGCSIECDTSDVGLGTDLSGIWKKRTKSVIAFEHRRCDFKAKQNKPCKCSKHLRTHISLARAQYLAAINRGDITSQSVWNLKTFCWHSTGTNREPSPIVISYEWCRSAKRKARARIDKNSTN